MKQQFRIADCKDTFHQDINTYIMISEYQYIRISIYQNIRISEYQYHCEIIFDQDIRISIPCITPFFIPFAVWQSSFYQIRRSTFFEFQILWIENDQRYKSTINKTFCISSDLDSRRKRLPHRLFEEFFVRLFLLLAPWLEAL